MTSSKISDQVAASTGNLCCGDAFAGYFYPFSKIVEVFMAKENQTCFRRRTARRCAVAGAIVLSAHTAPALAYLDPGTGSIILQGLLAGIAAVAVAGSVFWHRVKTKFTSLFLRRKSPATDSDQDP